MEFNINYLSGNGPGDCFFKPIKTIESDTCVNGHYLDNFEPV